MTSRSQRRKPRTIFERTSLLFFILPLQSARRLRKFVAFRFEPCGDGDVTIAYLLAMIARAELLHRGSRVSLDLASLLMSGIVLDHKRNDR